MDLSTGNLNYADVGNCVLRIVAESTDIRRTVAGNALIGPDYAGDSEPAKSAQLSVPPVIAVEVSIANLHVVMRMVASCTGDISNITGSDLAGSKGDGGLATSLLHLI